MIGALQVSSAFLFAFSRDMTFELLVLPSSELILEPDFGTKQPKKDVKRDMIGVFKNFRRWLMLFMFGFRLL